MLSSRVAADHANWDLHLQRCLLAYRCSGHSSTKETPCKLMLGRELNLPIDIMFHNPATDYSSVPDHMENLRLPMQTAFAHARKSDAQAQRRQKAYYDKRSNSPTFSPGDIVLLHSPVIKPGITKKFHRPWIGPFRIVSAIDRVVYRIEN